MKFVSYLYHQKHNSNREKSDFIQQKADYGILINDSLIIPMRVILAELNYQIPESLLEFIKLFGTSINPEIDSVLSSGLSSISTIAINKETSKPKSFVQAKMTPGITNQIIPLNQVKLIAPIRNPRRNVFCVGKNYKDHALEVTEFTKEASVELPQKPIYFSKACDVLLGDGEIIELKKEYASKLDYEVELAIIIAKDGIDISIENAAEYIFGYSIGNDISARDTQTERGQWFKGKSLDNSLVLGPYIVSSDEISYPPQLNISAKVNSELRQNSNTSDFIFDIATLISDLSTGLTLRAGDIIMTGTPAGVGVAMQPPQYLKSGDLIEFEIEQIGKLSNSVKLSSKRGTDK